MDEMVTCCAAIAMVAGASRAVIAIDSTGRVRVTSACFGMVSCVLWFVTEHDTSSILLRNNDRRRLTQYRFYFLLTL